MLLAISFVCSFAALNEKVGVRLSTYARNALFVAVGWPTPRRSSDLRYLECQSVTTMNEAFCSTYFDHLGSYLRQHERVSRTTWAYLK